MLILQKKSALMPLGTIRKLPIAFQPTFYSKVVECTKGVGEPMLNDSIAVLADQVAVLNQIVASGRSSDGKTVENALLYVQKFWTSLHFVLKGYQRSTSQKDAVLATKALELYKNVQGRMLRTNALDQLTAFINNIDNAWKPEELAGTFLETWRAQLVAVANDYRQVYETRVDNGASHICFSEKKVEVFEAFHFFYLNLYVVVGLTGDLALSKVQSEINELIMIYTTIAKSRATRIANQKRGLGDESQTTEHPSDDEVAEETETPPTAEASGEVGETKIGERA